MGFTATGTVANSQTAAAGSAARWGITLPWILEVTVHRKRIERKMVFFVSRMFGSSGQAKPEPPWFDSRPLERRLIN